MMSRIVFIILSIGTHTPGVAAGDRVADEQAQALRQTVPQKTGVQNFHPEAQWFPGAGLGLFIHWGLASVSATGDLSWGMLLNKPWTDATVTPNFYYRQADRWKPD